MGQSGNDKPYVIAVVLNWNGYDDTVGCVRSLQEAGYERLDVLIVDNASKDGSAERLRAAFPGVHLIENVQNYGYARGNNIGIREALARGAQYVLVLNNDVVLTPGFLTEMVEIAESDKSIGIVSPKILYFDEPGKIYAAGGTYNRWLCGSSDDSQGLPDEYCDDEKDRTRDITFATGCAMLVRSNALNKVGLFEERFFIYFEDLDLSQRINRFYRIVYAPRSRVLHKCGAGRGWGYYTPFYLYQHTRNRLWYYLRGRMFQSLYAVAFTAANTVAKTIAIIFRRSIQRDQFPYSKFEQLRSLWRGFRDGLKGMPT